MWLLHKYLKIRTTLPFVYLCNKATLDWEFCGRLIEQEHISLIFFGTHWVAMEINPSHTRNKATQKSKSAIEAIIKCFLQIKLESKL